jgi:hypothetical protein
MITTTEELEYQNAKASVNRFIANYLEAQVSLWDSYVDPKEAFLGSDGEIWESLGGSANPQEELAFRNCTELFKIQSIGRCLWRDNEFAINGHKNRINYIVGSGHKYTVVGKTKDVPDPTVKQVQEVLDEILKVNKWNHRQKEIKLRDDRDGETFIRKFRSDDGIMKFRFIEPRSIQPPNMEKPYQSYGIETEKDDVEEVLAYWVDGEPIEAYEIQHRKWNVDSSIKRGLSLFFPVRKNLTRAAKLLRNMSLATEIQTAIALIRRHEQATRDAVRTFVSAKAEQQVTNPAGTTENILRYPPGSILDVPKGQDYDIPKQLDPSKTISALQAELRAIASRLVMPEFMLTSDASNANFSSTMVAEGPAVKNFESDQEEQIEYDLELLDCALDHAAESGLIPMDDRNSITIQVEPPSVQVRDRFQEAQVRQIDMGLGILSPQSATAQIQLDYEQEQTNLEQHIERGGGLPTIPKITNPLIPNENVNN